VTTQNKGTEDQVVAFSSVTTCHSKTGCPTLEVSDV